MTMMPLIPLLVYAAALVGYAVHFGNRNAALGRLSTALLVTGAIAHTFVVGMQTMAAGHLPITDAASAVSTFVLLLVLAYLYTEMATQERAMGVLITALVVLLQVVPVLVPGVEAPSDALRGPLFGLHVATLLFAYASFALACVVGVTYLLLFAEIKARHLGFFYARLPSLQSLDAMNSRAVAVGWACLTIGIVAGMLWTSQAPGTDPRVQAVSLRDPKILVALVCWLVYSFETFLARRLGWSGRRAAYLSVCGFAIVLLNFLPISYFLSKSHTF